MLKKVNKKFKAVIFDMDGVITNTMPYHFDAWVRVLASAGIKADCFDVYKREGQDGLTTVREIFKEQKKHINSKDARLILEKKEKLFKQIVKIKYVLGARPFIRSLKKHFFPLGLVTGTSRYEVEKILPKKLLKLFDVTVTGDEVRKSKPHPEPFLKAVAKLKLDTADVLVIENAPFGIESAKKAGMFCIALTTGLSGEYLKKADVILNELGKIPLMIVSTEKAWKL